MADNDLTSKDIYKQIQEALEPLLKNQLENDAKNKIQDFKKKCRDFINEIIKIAGGKSRKQQISERIGRLGALIRDQKNTQVLRDVLVASHKFETDLNTFLGRAVPITNIEMKTGEISILSQDQMSNMYKKARRRKGQTFRGKLTAQDIWFNKDQASEKYTNEFLEDEKRELQRDINIKTQAKAVVFHQSIRRWRKSPSMDYAQKEKNKPYIPNLYWHLPNWEDIDWSKHRIGSLNKSGMASGGAIGEGWVNYIVNEADENTIGPYIHEVYNEPLEIAIEKISQLTKEYDATPGILKGDVQVKNSQIQLAVKQGKYFNSASILGNITIAYAFLISDYSIWMAPENLKEILEQHISSLKGKASGEAIFEALTGKHFKGNTYKIII